MEGNGDRKLNSYQIGISWTTVGAGGSARIFRDLAKGLPAEGVGFAGAVASPDNVSLLSGGAVESFCSEDAWAAVRLMAARRVILSAIRSTKPDLVASHFALFAAPIADQLRRQAHVVHFHGPWAAESKLEGAGPFEVMGKSLVERMAYSTADRVIILSNAFAKIAHRAYGIPEEILRIVPGAVDVDRFNIGESQREARELLGWPTDRRIIVSVRRLVSRMGLDRLISAFGSIHLKHPETVLYIVGKGRLRAELEQRASALNLQEKIRFHGFVADEHLPLVYRAADFSIVPTTALEGFGLVAAESLAAGTPCVVTPVGGLPDIVAGLSGSLILRSVETVDLADGLSQILSGATVLPSGARCIEHVLQNFTVDLMARRTAQVYREALRTK
jgi:glycosyltransferase involved in cell wall biosynthesis